MATYTLSAGDALLKDLYVGPIIEQLNYKTWMLDKVERDTTHVDHTGRRAIFPVHANRNRGRGSRGDNANLPVAGYNVDLDAIIPIKYHYYGMEISDPTIEASKRNEGAFANLLTRESTMIAKEMKKNINRQVFGEGTGALTTVRANSTSTTVNTTSNQYIGVGDPVDVLLAADGTVTNGVAGATVTARDNTAGANTITIDSALAGTAGTTYSVYIAGSYNKEMDGLRNMVNTSRTLHSINSSTAGQEFWNAGSLTAVGSNIAGENRFEVLADAVGKNGNGEVETFITTRGIKRRLADTYQSQKRFNDARAVDIHGGYTAIYVNETPVVIDDDCPLGYAFGLNMDSFRWFEQAGPGWLESKDGTVFHLKNSSTAGQKMNVWQAWFRWYASFGCIAPNRNGALSGCDDETAS